MRHEYYLIAVVLLLWAFVLRYFFRTYSRVTFVNDPQVELVMQNTCSYCLTCSTEATHAL